jgi:uncharacterized membrane-anchored protein YitT (DUF2179 family)
MTYQGNETLNRIKTALFIFIGNTLLAFLVAAFIIPHDIVMGGTTGIAIVINKLTGFDTAVTVLILNTLLLILGLVVLGKKFFFTTIASTIIYPVMLGVFQRVPGIDRLTDDKLLASLFAGVLMGISLGLVMRVGSSTGGMDVTNLVLHKWTHIPVYVLVWISDIVVVGGQAIVSKPEQILLGFVVLVLESLVLDQVIIFGQSQIQVYVISPKYEEIKESLLKQLQAGVTLNIIETGALEQQLKGVMCVIPSRKLYYAKELIHSIDPDAFITITKIKEVRGRGFSQERRTLIIDGKDITK